ncbi:hypothetical protein ACLQ25_29660 [Micromonospora sp. DT44]|uniref:hypothetical protein n=1 Tax=Micromonospora sp. DT44 TaxID=3393439 RepID=UPI003CF9FE17
MFDGPDYELAWPRHLFVAEASALLATSRNADGSRVEWLLEEAFTSSTPIEDFKAAPTRAVDPFGDDDPWATASPGGSTKASGTTQPVVAQSDFLSELIKRADVLREAIAPRPYWPERTPTGISASRQPLSREKAKRRFVSLVAELTRNGYLERVFPGECVDLPTDVDVDESAKLQEMLGIPDLWPLQPAQWDDDVFYGVIEVIHDLVARPRERWWHNWNSCGWHYSGFAVTPARALYRWRVNKILADAHIALRLAGEGEDAGRLVHMVHDDRRVLVEQALRSPDPKAADQIKHAIALFRGRTATDQDKRSAIVTLAHVLERRRTLLKAELLRRDEGALFNIANEFAIRHENEQQKADYDPVFLDWIFWWYLATVELTDRLLTRGT